MDQHANPSSRVLEASLVKLREQATDVAAFKGPNVYTFILHCIGHSTSIHPAARITLMMSTVM